MYPEEAFMPNVEGDLPLHIVARKYCLREEVGDDTVGIILHTYPNAASTATHNGSLPLHELMTNPLVGLRRSDRVFYTTLAEYPDALSTPNAQGNLPLHVLISNPCMRMNRVDMLETLLQANPEAVYLADAQGQLPLHIAIRKRLCWDYVLGTMLKVSPDTIACRDATSGLHRFQLAGMVGCKVETEKVFRLLSARPDLVHSQGNAQRCEAG